MNDKLQCDPIIDFTGSDSEDSVETQHIWTIYSITGIIIYLINNSNNLNILIYVEYVIFHHMLSKQKKTLKIIHPKFSDDKPESFLQNSKTFIFIFPDHY